MTVLTLCLLLLLICTVNPGAERDELLSLVTPSQGFGARLHAAARDAAAATHELDATHPHRTLIHGDLKAANVFLNKAGDDGETSLLDRLLNPRAQRGADVTKSIQWRADCCTSYVFARRVRRRGRLGRSTHRLPVVRLGPGRHG
jgi:hypothetical protein